MIHPTKVTEVQEDLNHIIKIRGCAFISKDAFVAFVGDCDIEPTKDNIAEVKDELEIRGYNFEEGLKIKNFYSITKEPK